MTGPWKAWKTKSRFPPSSQRPLEIWHTPPDSHIPTAGHTTVYISSQPGTTERNRPLRALLTPNPFRIILYWNRSQLSGSFLDWNMLRTQIFVSSFVSTR